MLTKLEYQVDLIKEEYTEPLLSSYSTTETNDGVGICKNNVIKYVPLGAYPEGQKQVKAALNYCDSLA